MPDYRDEIKMYTPEVFAFLDTLISSNSFTSIHYYGHAYKLVLDLFIQKRGADFTVTDWSDIWGTGADFFAEEGDGIPHPQRPDWLMGIPFYQEGIPSTDLLIWDLPPQTCKYLGEVVRRRSKRRPPPRCLLLLAAATQHVHYAAYDWTVEPFYAYGVRRSPSA